MIEGEFNPGERIAVVDDILISGGSVLEGIGKLATSGLERERCCGLPGPRRS